MRAWTDGQVLAFLLQDNPKPKPKEPKSQNKPKLKGRKPKLKGRKPKLKGRKPPPPANLETDNEQEVNNEDNEGDGSEDRNDAAYEELTGIAQRPPLNSGMGDKKTTGEFCSRLPGGEAAMQLPGAPHSQGRFSSAGYDSPVRCAMDAHVYWCTNRVTL